MKRPISLVIVAAIFICLGVSGVWQMVAGALRGNIIINLGFIGLIAGIGLLTLNRPCYQLSVGLLFASLVLVIGLGIYAFCRPENIVIRFPSIGIDQRAHPAAAILGILGVSLTYVVLIGFMLWTLLRREVRDLFPSKADAANPVATI
jgi:hypothetical protein